MKLQFRKIDLICDLRWIKTGENESKKINYKTTCIQISVYTKDNESLSNVFGNVGGIYKRYYGTQVIRTYWLTLREEGEVKEIPE